MKRYELTDHRGNVQVIVTDRKLPGATVDHPRLSLTVPGADSILYYLADVAQAQDYYPFGMVMPGRSAGTEAYRYAYNGKEQDPQTYAGGYGTIYDYGFRIYNPRLAKFLSVDPLTRDYAMLTPYQFASNRPIDGVDLDGLEFASVNEAERLITIHAAFVSFKSGPREFGPWGNYSPAAIMSSSVDVYNSQLRNVDYIHNDKIYNVQFDVQVIEYETWQDFEADFVIVQNNKRHPNPTENSEMLKSALGSTYAGFFLYGATELLPPDGYTQVAKIYEFSSPDVFAHGRNGEAICNLNILGLGAGVININRDFTLPNPYSGPGIKGLFDADARLATDGGQISREASASIIHELGHNLGLWHNTAKLVPPGKKYPDSGLMSGHGSRDPIMNQAEFDKIMETIPIHYSK